MNDFGARPMREEDLDWVLGLEVVEREEGWLQGSPRETYLAQLGAPDMAHVVFEQDGARVGYAVLAGLLSPNRSIELRRLVIEAKGQGLGRAALRWVRRFAFAQQGAHRLWLDTYEHNERAQTLYESEGWVREGMLREATRTENGYVSMVIYSLLASDGIAG